jgi:Ser-tRNA(Ala) deacylase AlaX
LSSSIAPAFYPTSGGQPFDTGTLGGARVVDVVDEDDGRIAHIVEHPAPLHHPAPSHQHPAPSHQHPAPSHQHPAPSTQHLAPGVTIRGEIDWTRRFDHMQQHTGQHVLSAAFDRLFGVRTVSFHLGGDVSTIDLAREMKPDEIAAAEADANRIVWEDRPVSIRFATKEEAATLPLRKESLRDGTLRLIDIEQWDLSACGGTHVARTGAIGVIAVAASGALQGWSASHVCLRWTRAGTLRVDAGHTGRECATAVGVAARIAGNHRTTAKRCKGSETIARRASDRTRGVSRRQDRGNGRALSIGPRRPAVR